MLAGGCRGAGPSFPCRAARCEINGVSVGFSSGGKLTPGKNFTDPVYSNKVSPWDNREYRGIRLQSSAGLGLRNRSGKLSAACYPTSGSVTIYPRALLEDAVRYATTPSTRPK